MFFNGSSNVIYGAENSPALAMCHDHVHVQERDARLSRAVLLKDFRRQRTGSNSIDELAVQDVRMSIADRHGSDGIPGKVIYLPLLRDAVNIDKVYADFAIVPRCGDAIASEIHTCGYCCL